ncbi:hypothetical protein [Macrococcus brunensis]|uniref:hypothetical protein n=1 Tax=Macrococcus brunensis TaxID=198483 RepID=UPI001EF014AD|nr:hypothetical protein [Macrococcus brunensis]ULG72384.1 hypothetical protein MGG12_02365 [Macrococcus brunensis]
MKYSSGKRRNEIYILIITDLKEEVLYKNEELISDIEGLAHHLVIEKGSTQLFEFVEINKEEFQADPLSQETLACQIIEYRDRCWAEYVQRNIYPKYPLISYDAHQKTFTY